MTLKSVINEQEIDREIAEIDRKLKDVECLQRRRAELVQFKQMARRLFGGNSSNVPEAEAVIHYTTSGLLHSILLGEGPKTSTEILAAARIRGYTGSGNDDIDKKRLQAALYAGKERFEKVNGKWQVKK